MLSNVVINPLALTFDEEITGRTILTGGGRGGRPLYHATVYHFHRVGPRREDDGPCLFFAWNGRKVREACVLYL